MTQRHKVFISYHHGDFNLPGDQRYKEEFEQEFSGVDFISRSVAIGDINPHLNTDTIRQKIRDDYLRDSTVTIVLVGAHTWKRKHVDWEIGSSIRHTKYNHRSGLIGIILPTHPLYQARNRGETLHSYCNPIFTRMLSNDNLQHLHTIPPRLYDNIANDYASYYFWPPDPLSPTGHGNSVSMTHAIEKAFRRRTQEPPPDNSYPSFVNNRPGAGWR